MPLHLYREIDDLKIMVWELTERLPDLLLQLNLSNADQQLFAEIKSEKRQKEFLGIRLILNKLIKTKVNICYHYSGKPFLVNGCYKISISHSGSWIAVAIHPLNEPGIDIEQLNDKFIKIYKRYLSPIEQEELYSTADIRKLQVAWSVKEALYKIIGSEAVDFANQLKVENFRIQDEGELCAIHVPSNKQFKLTYLQTADYTLVYGIE